MSTLVWQRATLKELSDIFAALGPAEQGRVADEIIAFNARLRSDALEVGESRAAGDRIEFVAGLAVWFAVDPDGPSVLVTHVHRPQRRPPTA